MTPAAAEARRPLTPAERQALIDETLANDEVVRRAANRRGPGALEAWLYSYLPDDFTAGPGAFHRGIYADLEAALTGQEIDGAVRDAIAYAYPRGHGKTTTITKGVLLHVIHEWRSLGHFRGRAPFILIVGDKIENARDRVLDLRDELEGNEALRRDYGDLTGLPTDGKRRNRVNGRKWTESDFTTTTGVRVKAVGANGRVRGLLRRGRRPNLIVLDDVENDTHVETSQQRTKLERWLNKALLPTGLQDELLTIAVGTILHPDSLLLKLLDPKRYTGWLKRRFAARYNDHGLPDVDGRTLLWPEFWTDAKLRRVRFKIGSVAFAQEYLNQPIDDETALFRREWLEAAKRRGRGLGFLYGPAPRVPFNVVVSTWDYAELVRLAGTATAYQVVITAWDLGIVGSEKEAKERDTDFTVGITVGLTLSDRIEVRRIYRRRGMTPAELRERILAEQRVLEADVVVVETNAAQKMLELDLRGVPELPIVGHVTDRRKHDVYEGVPGMALLLELERMDFAWDTDREQQRVDELINELHGLGQEAHDDLVMALWLAIVRVRKWQRVRDTRRRRLLGDPTAGYVNPFPTREERAAA